MPIEKGGKKYYRTSEFCDLVGISKGTLFRWLRVGVIKDVSVKDRNGWRLFTDADVKRVKGIANKTIES